jgi:predicted RNA-binding Zn-ribbon protein involved in translation (DUF1610 family)
VARRLCGNLNHRRTDAPVRHCPDCGEVVNPAVRVRRCLESRHAERRRSRSNYCVDCGEQLIR